MSCSAEDSTAADQSSMGVACLLNKKKTNSEVGGTINQTNAGQIENDRIWLNNTKAEHTSRIGSDSMLQKEGEKGLLGALYEQGPDEDQAKGQTETRAPGVWRRRRRRLECPV